ncbi:RNA polymerase subunit sigma-70 [Agromyces sp. Soil535]|uniref:RNA polymerase subunit sigma-70 n=1 Tax=Agromyces sp. Soil535 TaxID=1736390 RepID=UPI0007013810|nr:RNA polymerase subunit sigma-70 [Agromyces sp. Soil535]KRE31017.1 RNA polymerase subunit sigma-70 [Agromyces sp. Soil535]
MSDQLMHAAKAGDRAAFDELVGPHRDELRVHCYRMLGSLHDAEDAVQKTLLSAWLALDGFAARSSLRTWLYRIATNRCLNLLRSARRRPGADQALPVPAPEPTRLGEVFWLQPYPDVLFDELASTQRGPDAVHESREAISLAFVTAIQLLPPKQRAVLLLRDVLGYNARETAGVLDTSVESANSALQRARATLATSYRPQSPPPSGGVEEQRLVDRLVEALLSGDIAGLVALMNDDVWVRMPPLPFEYHGREAAEQFFAAAASHRRGSVRLVPTHANGQPAWGDYHRDPCSGGLIIAGIEVLGLDCGGVSEFTRFEASLAPYFGLPNRISA